MSIHPTALVDRRAEIDPSAEIGPYVVIDGPVRIGPGTVVHPYVRLCGQTEIGAECRIHSGAVVGDLPQDRAWHGGETLCRIGDETVLREGVTVHRATEAGTATVVGRRCYLMANSHVGHNCLVEDDVTLANGALLAGYVQVGRRAFLSGNAAVHQFVRVGELAMIGGLTKLTQDFPPFFLSDRDSLCAGVNVVGLRRAGFTPDERQELRRAYGILYRSTSDLRRALDALERTIRTEAGRRLLEFLRAPTRRGLVAGRHRLRPRSPAPDPEADAA